DDNRGASVPQPYVGVVTAKYPSGSFRIGGNPEGSGGRRVVGAYGIPPGKFSFQREFADVGVLAAVGEEDAVIRHDTAWLYYPGLIRCDHHEVEVVISCAAPGHAALGAQEEAPRVLIVVDSADKGCEA